MRRLEPGFLCLALAAVAVPSLSLAQAGHGVSLEWKAPGGCPDSSYVLAEVERQLSGSTADRKVTARATVEDTRTAFRLRLTVETGGTRGERSLDAETCRAAADAAALIVAMAVDPTRVLTQPSSILPLPPPPASAPPSTSASQSASAPPAPSGSASASASASASPPSSAPVRKPPPRSPSSGAAEPVVALGAGFVADTATFARLSGAPEVTAAWTPSPFRLELAFDYWLGQRVTLADSPPNAPRGGDLGLWTLGLRGCYAVLHEKHVELSPCTGLELGNFRAASFGVSEPGSASRTWSAGRVGILLGVPLFGPLALRLALDAVVPFDRPRFFITGVGDSGEGDVHRPAGLTGRATAGLELRL